MPIRGSKRLRVLILVSKVVLTFIIESLLPLRTKRVSSSIPKLIEGPSSKALSIILGESLSFFAFFIEGLRLRSWLI